MIYTLYYVHDPMCSWCYAFKSTLEKLKKNLDSNIKIVHVVGGLAKDSDEIMPKDMQEKIENIWYEIEKVTGTKFNHDFWKICQPRRSTYIACKATMLARYENKENEMIEAIQEAYYQKALNPSDATTLINLSKQIGMDEKKFEEDLKSQKIENIWYEIEDVTGTKFNHDFWKKCSPRRSTYLACEATILARYENKEEEMINAIQEAYYQKAMNPSDATTLISLAKQIGMDEKKFEEDLKSQKIEDDLQNELNFRRSLHVKTFPSLILEYKKELYPINIKYNDYEAMLNQIKKREV